MLSEHEQRVLDEIERGLTGAAEAAEPGSPDTPRPAPRRGRGRHSATRALWVVGCCAGLLLLTGAVVAALAIAAAGTTSCLWWRYWRLLRDDGGIAIPPGTARDPGPTARPRRLGGQWLTRYLERISEVE
jgi:hypothetical protein